MTSRNSKGIGAAVAGVACIVVVAGLPGCGSDEPEPTAVVARNYAPPPPPPPKLTPISELMIQLGIDERVRLPEDKAPDNDQARRAVLEFFDAFARGDDQVVASMVSTADRLELEALVDSGAWAETTNQITRIDVQTGSDPQDVNYTCALAIIYVDGSFQPQLWHYSVDDMDGARFDRPSILRTCREFAPPLAEGPLTPTDEEGPGLQFLNRDGADPSRGDRPRLISLRRADVGDLLVSDVDLRACQFAGAHNLDI